MNRRIFSLLAPLAVIALVLIFFARLAFTNLILARGDTYAYFYPYWHAAGQALRAGRLPLWNDLLFMGAPFLANSQVGLLYPPNWPLWALVPDTPTAIKLSILLHLAWAGLGTFVLLRGPLRLGPLAALTGAALFAVGGHLTAHVEQINQAQGLAWLPWLFLLLDLAESPARTRPWRYGPLLAGALALQFLSGHTQTVFIGLVGMGIMAAWWGMAGTSPPGPLSTGGEGEPRARSGPSSPFPHRWGKGSNRRLPGWGFPFQSTSVDFSSSAPELRSSGTLSPRRAMARFRPLIVLLVAGAVAVLLALPQLLPTLELSGLSNRSGGLDFNEVISFSLHPALFGRALLPGYDVALHNEYLGSMGIAGLALALVGAWAARREPHWQAWIVVAGLGLFLAFGGWNPLYWLLGRLPGFNLFRVPARWLALWALGGSVLAAYAVQRWRSGDLEIPGRFALALGIVVIALTAGTYLSPLGGDQLVQGTVQPSWSAVIGWLVTGGVIVALLLRAPGRWAGLALPGLAVLELFVASAHMPYNRLNAPEAFAAQRPAISQLLARQDESDPAPPGRFLSLSDIFFDPGDLPELRAIYGPQLAPESLDDFIVTVKMRDVIAPNLGLAWSLPGVDGFDGGLLPLRAYTEFSRLLLPDPPPDGRLRENLPAIPARRWLDLMGVRYLITDKVGDDWYGGVFYDLQWETPLSRSEPITVGHVPDFEATALGVVYADLGHRPMPQGRVEVTFGEETFSAEIPIAAPEEGRPYAYAVLSWEAPRRPESIAFTGSGLALRGAALIDERTGAFQSLTVTPGGSWRLIHSGDVKIYENLAPLPRAFLVYAAEVVPDNADALARMAAGDFDPSRAAILAGGAALAGPTGSGEAVITSYAPERVEITVATDADAYLVLADAFYPGWTAILDGEPVLVARADVLFRAVLVPAGEHTLVMAYTPTSWPGALIVGALAWLGLLGVCGWRGRRAGR